MFKNRKNLIEKWNRIEQSLSQSCSIEYQHAWGEARQKFYQEIGYIPCSEKDTLRLRSLKGAFSGERIFVIGNGPSLNRTPLHFLENEFTFVTNRAYLLFDRITWRPSFYTTLDWRVVPDIAHEINLLNGMLFFFEERFKGLLRDDNDVFWYTHTPAMQASDKLFAYDISSGVRGAGSVIGTAIQIAFFLGFREIYLIGCDLGYRVNKNVKQEGEDVFKTGTKLLLTSTEDDDLNHFDVRYFGKGRRWHDPNVKRMIAGHEQCKIGVEKGGGKILNATIGGELEVYPRVDFLSLFPKQSTSSPREIIKSLLPSINSLSPIPFTENCLVGPLLRCENAHLDETDIISNFIISKFSQPGLMIDVGAHRGSSCVNFLKAGWDVFAFEPNVENKKALTQKVNKNVYSGRIFIDHRGVGATSKTNVDFYTSKESSGIAGLSAFHSSHQLAYKVDVISLRDYFDEKQLQKVDFLKIDTEGYDLFVLQGFPWEKTKPFIIECEFEDFKTAPLGYTFQDLIHFLTSKGYTIYVSEWHPIIRYGIRHNWKCLSHYPCKLTNERAWGNLLAFRDSINELEFVQIVRQVLNFANKPVIPIKEGLNFTDIVYVGDVIQDGDQYTLKPPATDNWIAYKYQGKIAPGDVITFNLNFCLNSSCILKLGIFRDGSTVPEAKTKKLPLTQGKHTIEISHTFKNLHQGVRIQIGAFDQSVIISGILSEVAHVLVSSNREKILP